MRTLAVAERLIEKYLKDEYTVAERAYELVIKVLENEKGWGNYRQISSGGRPCDFFTEKVERDLMEFTLFSYNILYRVGLELGKFQKKEDNGEIFILRIIAEIPMIDPLEFNEDALRREEILKRICEERGIRFYDELKGAGVYLLTKKLDFLSDEALSDEKLLVDLADFMEGLQEWYNTDPAR